VFLLVKLLRVRMVVSKTPNNQRDIDDDYNLIILINYIYFIPIYIYRLSINSYCLTEFIAYLYGRFIQLCISLNQLMPVFVLMTA
jgi:hypothetical protein